MSSKTLLAIPQSAIDDDRPKLVLGLGGNPHCPTVTVTQLCNGEKPAEVRKAFGLVTPHIGS